MQAMSTEEDLILERWIVVLNSLSFDDISGPDDALSVGSHCYQHDRGMLGGEGRVLASVFAVGVCLYACPKVLRTQRCRAEFASALAEEDHETAEEERVVYTQRANMTYREWSF